MFEAKPIIFAFLDEEKNAFAVRTHKHPKYGDLIRVLKPDINTDDSRMLHIDDVMFSCFFPVRAAEKRKIVELIGPAKISELLGQFPLFRVRGVGGVWWIWDGISELRVGDLSEEMRSLPVRGIWNDTLVRERAANRYTAFDDL